VNPLLGTFEDSAMQLKVGALCMVPKRLDFGLRNFELVDHKSFRQSGQSNTTLEEQTQHTDHRIQVCVYMCAYVT